MKTIKRIFAAAAACSLLFASAPACLADDGKYTDDIYVPYGTCLEIYDDENIKQAADNLFQTLDGDKNEDVKNIKTLYEKGEYLDSLILYRNYFVDKLRRTPMYGILMNTGGYSWNYWTNCADVMCGLKTLDDFNNEFQLGGRSDLNIYYDKYGYLNYIDPDTEMHCTWVGGEERDAKYTALPPYTYGGISGRIGVRYAETQDPVFIKKYFQVADCYAREYRKQLEAPMEGMSEEERKAYAENVDPEVYVPLRSKYAGQNIHYLQKGADIIGGLALICKAMPCEENAQITNWQEYNTEEASFTQKLDEKTYDLIDPVRLARFCYHLITGEQYRLSSYILYPNHITNQQIEGSAQYFRFMCMFSEFTNATYLKDEAMKVLNDVVGASFYKDGGVLEKSFNYNKGTVEVAKGLSDFAGMAPDILESLGDVASAPLYWERLQEGYSSNTGVLPNIGNQSNNGSARVWDNEEKYKAMENALYKNKALKYTSLAFPYSGYAALRDNWDIDGLYLSFYNNDYRASGHKNTGTNAIESLSAYGRMMLMSGGAPWYGRDYVKTYYDFLDSGYDEINGYMQEASSRKHSTVMVNGKSQASVNILYNADGSYAGKGENVTVVPEDVLNYRWGSSDYFDYTEGCWRGGYSALDTESALMQGYTDAKDTERSADHARQIIFVKEAGAWIVVDTLENYTGKQNEYTQVWNFMGYEEGIENLNGYKDEQVVIDNENKRVKTIDENGPNLNIINLSENELEYEKYCGWYEPGKTGWGWQKGGKNRSTGDYAARPDVLVSWKDNGIKGETTKVYTILAPTKDMSDPITSAELIKEDGYEGIEFKTAAGIDVKYYTSKEPRVFNIGEIETFAKEILVTNNGGKIRGLVLDCEYFSVNNVITNYNIYDNFSFSIGNEGIIEEVARIGVPELFEWITDKNGGYIPVYSEKEKERALEQAEKESVGFSDIEGHWAEKYISDLAFRNIIDEDIFYYPERAVTRAEFAKMLVKALGYTAETPYDGRFSDLDSEDEYAEYIEAAYEKGIIEGDGRNVYPMDSLTREAMAKMVISALGVNNDAGENSFSDKEKISPWAVPYVNKAAELGIIQGNEDGTFNPKGIFTRAEAAAVIYNFIK